MQQKKEDTTPCPVVLEGMTSLSALLHAYEENFNDRKILYILYDDSRAKKLARELSFLRAKSREHHFELIAADADTIAKTANGTTHGGVIALCTERTFPKLTREKISPDGFYVYLEGIEDPYNFGNTVRSLYAAGADAVILSPRNWMSAAGVVARASAGTSELMPIYLSTPENLSVCFHEAGYKICAAGIRDSVSLYEADLKKPLLLIVGGEKRGISGALLSAADQIVRIDYGRNFRGSLSAAAATAVMAFEIMHRNEEAK